MCVCVGGECFYILVHVCLIPEQDFSSDRGRKVALKLDKPLLAKERPFPLEKLAPNSF